MDIYSAVLNVCYKGPLTRLMVFKQMLEQVLRELQPLCTAEQQFIEEFFQLSRDAADLQVLEVSVRTMSTLVPLTHPPSSLIKASADTVRWLLTSIRYLRCPGLLSSSNCQWCW